MLNVKIDDDTNLVVYSEWDSVVHKCFKALIHRKGEYCGETLNLFDTKILCVMIALLTKQLAGLAC